MVKSAISALLCLVVLFLHQAEAAEQGRMNSILMTVTKSDGFLDKSLYDSFWASIPSDAIGNKAKTNDIAEQIHRTIHIKKRFDREVWESRKQSIQNRKPIKTETYKAIVTQIKNNKHQDHTMVDDDSAAFESNIELVSHGMPIEIKNETSRPINIYEIELAISEINSAIGRIDRLLTVPWRDNGATYQSFDDGHFTLFGTEQLRRSAEVRELKSLGQVDSITYSLPSTGCGVAFISYQEIPGSKINRDNLAHLLDSIADISGDYQFSRVIDWRGLQSSEIIAAQASPDGMTYISVRHIASSQRNALWSIYSFSCDSVSAAVERRHAIEQTLMVKDQYK